MMDSETSHQTLETFSTSPATSSTTPAIAPAGQTSRPRRVSPRHYSRDDLPRNSLLTLRRGSFLARGPRLVMIVFFFFGSPGFSWLRGGG